MKPRFKKITYLIIQVTQLGRDEKVGPEYLPRP